MSHVGWIDPRLPESVGRTAFPGRLVCHEMVVNPGVLGFTNSEVCQHYDRGFALEMTAWKGLSLPASYSGGGAHIEGEMATARACLGGAVIETRHGSRGKTRHHESLSPWSADPNHELAHGWDHGPTETSSGGGPRHLFFSGWDHRSTETSSAVASRTMWVNLRPYGAPFASMKRFGLNQQAVTRAGYRRKPSLSLPPRARLRRFSIILG
jgi:hypothetical protein